MSFDADTVKLEHSLKAANRILAIKQARESLLSYVFLSMPDPEHPDDATKSSYTITPQGRLLCEIMERMYRGELFRVAVSIGPQYGKSEIITRKGPAWISGKNPRANIMVGAYNQDFANDFGGDVKDIIGSPWHKQVFPNHVLTDNAVDDMKTSLGGKLAFVGVGGSGTGKSADFFIVDDPIRNDEDAQSDTYRNKVWKWLTSVVFSRALTKTRILIVHTRWHGDDPIGRLCDPDHPERNREYRGIDKHWTYINIPAVIDDPVLAKSLGLTLEVQTDPIIVDAFGEKPIATLSPERKSFYLLAEAKQLDRRAFGALYMGKPSPDDGDYFKADWLVEYEVEDLPENLRYYGASDHAASEKTRSDLTVLGVVGLDEKDNIWVLPDLVWDRMETDRTVDEMIRLMKQYKPMMWWLENELISKSFGPFLYKAMQEKQCYTYVDPVSVHKTDKQLRARSIQGRMAHKKVRFPKYAPWWQDARGQLLKFPFAAKDDFVDFIAHIGHGLIKEIAASPVSETEKKVDRPGSIEWILNKSKQRILKGPQQLRVRGW